MNQLAHLVDDGRFVLPLRLRSGVKPRRLVLLLHGVGGNETNLADLAARLPEDTAVALVRAPIAIGPGQFAWFRVSFTANGPSIDEAEAERSRRLLITLVAQLAHMFGLEAADIALAGFSQGGIMSASVALTSPDTARSFAILCGRILPEILPLVAPRRALAQTRGFIGHGRLDEKLPVSWAEGAHALLDRIGVAHELRLYDIGHELGLGLCADFLNWMQ